MTYERGSIYHNLISLFINTIYIIRVMVVGSPYGRYLYMVWGYGIGCLCEYKTDLKPAILEMVTEE